MLFYSICIILLALELRYTRILKRSDTIYNTNVKKARKILIIMHEGDVFLLTIEGAAKVVGISPQYIRSALDTGELKFMPIGAKGRKIPTWALLEWQKGVTEDVQRRIKGVLR